MAEEEEEGAGAAGGGVEGGGRVEEARGVRGDEGESHVRLEERDGTT